VYGDRATDVRMIYEDPGKTVSLMEKYGLNLLYVGDAERERYQISLPETGLSEIYDQQGVQIYRIVPA
jgi:uncharacterized membrane protein